MAGSVKTVVFVAGKSGGHIIPCITLMQQHYAQHQTLFFTTDNQLDHTIIQKHAPQVTHITLPLGLSYTNAWKALPRLAWRLLISCFISIKVLRNQRPERIITTGGIIAIPVCLAGYVLKIPIDIYELNAIPGKTTTFLSRIATRIKICFNDARAWLPASKCTLTPYPLRYTPEATINTLGAPAICAFDSTIPTLLVLGGSQGSISLNNALKKTLDHRTQPLQVIHQTGSLDTTDWHKWYAQQGITAHVMTYEHNLAPFLATSTIILCRAGAGTLFEALSFKKPCIVVPLEGLGDNHQIANAHAMQKMYSQCSVLKQSTLHNDNTLLMHTIEHILNSLSF